MPPVRGQPSGDCPPQDTCGGHPPQGASDDRSSRIRLWDGVLGGCLIGLGLTVVVTNRVVDPPLHDLDGVGVVFLTVGILLVGMAGHGSLDRLRFRQAIGLAITPLVVLVTWNALQQWLHLPHLLTFGATAPLFADLPMVGLVVGTFDTQHLPAFFAAWFFALPTASTAHQRLGLILALSSLPVALALDQAFGVGGFGAVAGLAIASFGFVFGVLYAVPLVMVSVVLSWPPEVRQAWYGRVLRAG